MMNSLSHAVSLEDLCGGLLPSCVSHEAHESSSTELPVLWLLLDSAFSLVQYDRLSCGRSQTGETFGLKVLLKKE